MPGVEARHGAAAHRRAVPGSPEDLADVEAGLDSLDSVPVRRTPLWSRLRRKVLPPLFATVLALASWQLAVSTGVAPPDKLPSPASVADSFRYLWLQGSLFEIIWTSVRRGLLGFLVAVAIGTPLGLIVARVALIRAALGPVLSGLQSLPSVAWVPAAVLWLGLTSSAMYAVILLGAVPSIANGLTAGIRHVPPLHLKVGRSIGATGWRSAWHVLMPAALPSYLSGLKQGWAFSWRSLMAAELIASSPDLGVGLGRYLENARESIDLPGVFLGIALILLVGVAVDLLVFCPLERRVLRSRGLLTEG
ncbi:ABC transporter permease [Streptomyces argenteolus]|uniref:ABC transporter permease n=1 Tax=Streptomyces argenteolus TaxID=67274 RepID=A0ABW6XBQ0_9ACTN